ncbi:MAG: hypothetical protein ACI8WM_000204 [Burkholderiaceae bacterium]|jgi:hypothetical protein
MTHSFSLKRGLLALLMLATCMSAHAVFRCDAQGKVTYSDVACEGGIAVPASDLRAQATMNAERDDAMRRAAAEKVQLQRLEVTRSKAEHAERKERLHASAVASARRRKCETLDQRRKWADEDAATATGRHAEKALRKARRIAEQYVLDCKA